jgi:murein DD-endopeptidase MepM/ murein hydrolase activator NlpD
VVRSLVRDIVRLDEFKFATGYTDDPEFKVTPQASKTDAQVDQVDVAQTPPAAPAAPTGGQVPASAFTAQGSPRSFKGVTVTDVYGKKRGAVTHYGIDLAKGSAPGTPIYAALAGAVVQAGKDTRPRYSYQPDGNAGPNGNFVQIRHSDGTSTFYLHLDTVGVSVGGTVTTGQQIGTMGNTGEVSGVPGVHLHFAVHDSSKNPVDPIAWMQSHSDAVFPVQVDQK